MTKAKLVWGVVATISALLGFVLTQGPSVLENIQILPEAYEKTSVKIKSVYFKDAMWSGTWSSSADYDYTYEEGDTTETDIIINLSVEQGEAFGEFYSRSLCEAVPMLDFLLLEGAVDSGRTLRLIAYEMIGGKRHNFISITARLPSEEELKRGLITFDIDSGILGVFPERIRLKKQFNDDAEPGETHDYCLKKRFEFVRKTLEEIRGGEETTSEQKQRVPIGDLDSGKSD